MTQLPRCTHAPQGAAATAVAAIRDHAPCMETVRLALRVPGARGKGYATETAVAAINHGHQLLGRGEFVSYVYAANSNSSRLAARLGAARDKLAVAELTDCTLVWRHRGKA